MMNDLKRKCWERIRRYRLARKVQGLKEFFERTPVKTGLPENLPKAVLVLSPHPDDESIGCGGTIKLLTLQGVAVDVLFVTNGALARKPGAEVIRPEEARLAAKVLGIRELFFLKGQAEELLLQPWLSDDILERLHSTSYDLILAPWPYDSHIDHVLTFEFLQQALSRYEKSISVWLYEIWGPLLANRAVAIDATADCKLQAIECHKTQVAVVDYPAKFLALAHYRSLFCRNTKYAEAFFECEKEFLVHFLGRKTARSMTIGEASKRSGGLREVVAQ